MSWALVVAIALSAGTPLTDGERAVLAVPVSVGAAATGLAVGSVAGVAVAFASGAVGNRDFLVFVALGTIAGGATSWLVTALIIDAILDGTWPDYTGTVIGGVVVLGALAGLGAGIVASLAIFRGQDSCGAEIAAPPLGGMALGAVAGAVIPTVIIALQE